MAYTQAYTAYKATGVKTASQGKLIIMLYEEALRRMDAALALYNPQDKLDASSIEKFNNSLVKTQEIITELMVSLDMERGGEIAHNLMALYSFFNRELLDTCITHDKAKLISIRTMMHELHSSWAVAVAETPTADAAVHTAIDING